MIDMDHKQIIDQIKSDAITGFLRSIKPDGTYYRPVYKELNRLSEQTRDEYIGRFLIELIQNGYDAHPPGTTDGEIDVYLDPNEGDHGTLYVSNTGRPFSAKDVDGICNLGLSEKSLGDSIGNKGLGFRSVLAISREPEIYSKSDAGGQHSFDGFRFRFANKADLRILIPDRIPRDLAYADLPPLHVPVHISRSSRISQSLVSLARRGFSTVVRLPLSAAAQSGTTNDQVLRAIRNLRSFEAPVLAFLTRISKLTVTVEGDPSKSFELSRDIEAKTVLGDDTFESVRLSESGSFLICSRQIPENKVIEAIERSIDVGQLDTSWRERGWSGPGEVAIAVPLYPDSTEPQLYNFFPMGPESNAPLQGLIHAGFYSKNDRSEMDERVPLNDLYLREAIRLAATTIKHLRNNSLSHPGLTESTKGRLVVDLMCWSQRDGITDRRPLDFPTLIVDALSSLDLAPDSHDLFPVISTKDSVGWASAPTIASWDSYRDREEISLNNLVEYSNICALHPDLQEDRVERLRAFLSCTGLRQQLDPDGETQAQAVAVLASKLPIGRKRGTKAVERWKRFYVDLEEILESVPESCWQDKPILLCGDSQLRATGSRASTRVYCPPRGRELSIPQSLRQYFAFLDPKLEWYGELQQTRLALESTHLVQDYDVTELIEGASSSIPLNADRRRSVLQWVFELWEGSGGRDLLGNVNLDVPVTGGKWLAAKEAFFSREWPESTLGPLLSSLVAKCAENANEIRELAGKQLAGLSAKPFDREKKSRWVEFLLELGVNRGLTLERRHSRPLRIPGFEVFQNPLDALCRHLRIGENSKEYIRKQTLDERERLPRITYTTPEHVMPTSVPYITGQEDFAAMDDDSKVLFAKLILELLPSMGDSPLDMSEVAVGFPDAGRTTWPSPAKAFLRQAEWMPMERVGSGQERYFSSPSRIILDGGGSQFPRYLPVPVGLVRPAFSQEVVGALNRICSAVIWNEKDSLIKQVQLLAHSFNSDYFPRGQESQFANHYWSTWGRVIEETSPDDWVWLDQDEKLCVFQVGGSPVAMPFTDSRISDYGIFVRDTPDELTPQLLDEIGRCVWNAGRQIKDGASGYLRAIFGNSVHRISDLNVFTSIDGQPAEDVEGRRLVDLIPCIADIVARCMASQRGPVETQLPNDWTSYLKESEGIRFKGGKEIKISIEGDELRLPEDRYGCLLLGTSGGHTVLIEDLDTDNPDWVSLKKAQKVIAQAIGNVGLAHSIYTVFSFLESSGISPSEATSNSVNWATIEDDLQLTNIDKERVSNELNGDQEWILRHLKPVVIYHVGRPMFDQIAEQSGVETPTQQNLRLIEAISTEVEVDKIFGVLGAARGFRDVFEELCPDDLGKFNDALRGLGEEPVTYGQLHGELLQGYLNEEHESIQMAIRLAYLTEFQLFHDLKGYVQARDHINNLKPDPGWAGTIAKLDDEVLEGYIESAMLELGFPLQTYDPKMESLSSVLDSNRTQARATLKTVAPLVMAWSDKNNVVSHALWSKPDSLTDLLEALSKNGILDFIKLNEESILKWLVQLGYWPNGMDQSCDRGRLGLSPDDLDEVEIGLDQKRRDNERQRRSVLIDGENTRLVKDQFNVDELRDEFAQVVKAGLDKLPDLATIGQFRRPRARTASKGGIGGGRGGSHQGPTEDQTWLVGFTGELFVYEYLKQKMPNRNIDEVWVSGYRQQVTGVPGDDSRGCDFIIPSGRNRRKMFLEVKSHLGDPLTIEIGESEVRLAGRCAGKRPEGDFWIVYVSPLADKKENWDIEFLPNPFTDGGAQVFRTTKKGVVYRFNREVGSPSRT